MKRTYQPNNRRRKRTHGFSSACATRSGRAVLRRAGARDAKNSRCELGPGRPRDFLPGRPPSKTKGIRRVLRLRGARFRTTPPALSARRTRRRAGRGWASRCRGAWETPSCAIGCGGACGRSSGVPREPRRGADRAWSSSTSGRRPPRLSSRSSRRTTLGLCAKARHGRRADAVAFPRARRRRCSTSTSAPSPRCFRGPAGSSRPARSTRARRSSGTGWRGAPARRSNDCLAAIPSIAAASIRFPRAAAHGKTPSARGRPLARRPAPLGVGHPQARKRPRPADPAVAAAAAAAPQPSPGASSHPRACSAGRACRGRAAAARAAPERDADDVLETRVFEPPSPTAAPS